MIKERKRANFVPSLNAKPPPARRSILIYQLGLDMSKEKIPVLGFLYFEGFPLRYGGAHEQI
jgi:hypothetical protein